MGKNRISKKQLNMFIDHVSEIKPSTTLKGGSDCYYSKIDGSYITHIGLEKDGFQFLLKRGVTEQIQNKDNNPNHSANIGFNPEEKKWYGWSHRAICGFGIGSEVGIHSVGYRPRNTSDFKRQIICQDFLSEPEGIYENIKGKHTKVGVSITYTRGEKHTDYSMKFPETNKISRFYNYPEKWGKGFWIAQTLDDAKQMARDFAEGVS